MAGVGEPLAVGGLYELTIGVRSLDSSIRYWERFGYRLGLTGELTAPESLDAYGHRSSIRSARLLHGGSDHGLIRLLEWERPISDGVGLVALRALGSRWGAMLTRDLLAIQNHCESVEERGGAISWISSSRQDPAGPMPEPFLEDHVHVREMIVIQPEARQVLFQRFGYSNPTYGAVVDAAFPTSQVTHVGVVTSGDPEPQISFYERALGLLRTRDGSVSTNADMASRRIFDLAPGESYRCWDFDDPTSSPVPAQWRSGRLKFIHFDVASVPDVRTLAGTGNLGMTNYSWRVTDLDLALRAVGNEGAVDVGPIVTNEFGERQFWFCAPDGYEWLLLEDKRA